MFDYYKKKLTRLSLSLSHASDTLCCFRGYTRTASEKKGAGKQTTQTTGKVRSKVYGGALVWSCLLVNDVYLPPPKKYKKHYE